MGKVVVDEYDAVGGPATASMGTDGFKQGPTDAGEFVVAYCGRHRSNRYPDWSAVPWGAPLKEEKGELVVKIDGKWQKLSKLSRVTKADVEDQYFLLYGTRMVPSTWVFNDFGHMTCYLFKDRNKNRKLDGKERIHGEFLHTTPPDEAATAQGQSFSLAESHGCVHLRPANIDELIAKGYLAKGRRVVFHRYTERAIGWKKTRFVAKPPYEVHFFPGIKKIVVVGQSPF